MIARDLISDEIIPLRTSDSGEDALERMDDYHVRHLPIVNNRQLLGLISEEELFDLDTQEAVGSYDLKMVHPFVKDSVHIYDTMRVLHEYRLTLVPVVDKDNNYMGVVTLHDLLKYFAESASFSSRRFASGRRSANRPTPIGVWALRLTSSRSLANSNVSSE